jgi:hypothetical protein
MKKIITLLIILTFGVLNAAVITSWDFEAQNTNPSTGSGSLSLIGGVTSDNFNTGYADTGYAWSTTSYPAQGTNNRVAGMYVEVSSVGYSSISISWAIRHSNTSANRAVLYYTLDRTVAAPVWVEAGIFNAASGDLWVDGSFDGSSITGMNSNPNLAFKLVSSAYMPSKSTSTYAATGKWRYDNIVVSGTPLTPYLQITASLQPFYAAAGYLSSLQSYQISAQHLTGELIVTAPQYFVLRLEGDELFASQLSLLPRSGTINRTIQVLFQPVISGDFSGNIVHSGGGIETQNLAVYASTILPEPSSYPSGFAVNGITYYQAYLNWTDATGSTLPDGYLIKGSKISADEIVAPVDGVPEEDKKLTKNVAYGIQTKLIFELNEAHPYYFKIYPYTNSGTAIDYKADTGVPQLSFNTSAGPVGSVLSVGDLAFVEYACDSPDKFAFVLLTDVLENTKINFTDKAWTGTAFAETEEVYEWRGVARLYLRGEVIHVVEGTLQDNEGISNPDFEGFSNDGDQIIAFQGYITQPTFLAAFSTTSWLTGGIPGNNSSYLPEPLQQGVNALGFVTEIDNGYYSATQSGTVADIRQAINDPGNWTRANSLSGLSYPAWDFQMNSLNTPQLEIVWVDDTNIRLSWQDVADAGSYKIYASDNPYASFPSDWTVLVNGTTALYLNINTMGQTKRFYRVIAYN